VELNPQGIAAVHQIVKRAGQRIADTREFVLSTEAPDRTGDIVKASGWQLDAFKQNPVALFQHDHTAPIGVWTDVRVERGALLGTLNLAAAGTSRVVDTARALLAQGIIRAVSVGFRALRSEPIKGSYARIFHEVELLEASLVSVPANAQALAVAKSFGLNDAEMDQIFAATSNGGSRTGSSAEVILRAKHAIIAAKRSALHSR
jgi:HK97 family phage prohead protease